MSFADLGLSDDLLRVLAEADYHQPTPIQEKAIPSVLMMRDIIGIAQTGTGKTASFVLPMIDILAQGRSRARMPRSLILEPTRELATQLAENFEKYGKYHRLEMALLIGGVQMGDQIKALEKGIDVLIATPGRLLDLYERGKILLNGCELLVIDEADRMLDMGFIPDIETICTRLPTQRQTLLFSATMPPPIKQLAQQFLSNPKTIEVARPASTNRNITQALIRTTERNKRKALDYILQHERPSTAIIFCNRKVTVRDLARRLQREGHRAGEIHGDMEQPARNAELARFKEGVVNLLVASDVAARGLDIRGVSHVINYDTPWHPDDYVHRIGRTGRAGATGKSFTLVTSEDEEALEAIEKLTKTAIPEADLAAMAMANRMANRPPATESAPSPEQSDSPDESDSNAKRSKRKRRRGGRGRNRNKGTATEPVASTPSPHNRERDSARESSERARGGRERAGDASEGRRDARREGTGREDKDKWQGKVPSFLSVGIPSSDSKAS